jgi:hypothetical protein
VTVGLSLGEAVGAYVGSGLKVGESTGDVVGA